MKIGRKIRTAAQIVTQAGPRALLRAFVGHVCARLGPYRADESRIAFEALGADAYRGLMIDVGAHLGGAFAPFARCGWHVFAFEPDSSNRTKLLAKCQDWDGVVIDARAVSDEPQEEACIYTSDMSGGISSLSAFHSSHRPGEKVGVTTLSSFLGEQDISDKRIDFLKIDTEGFDLHVLRGFPWQKMTPRFIVCEFEDLKTAPLGYTFHDLAQFLVDHGYKIVVSEWYPIKEYGSKHDWKRFTTYPCELGEARAWGNLLATNEQDIYDKLVTLCHLEPEQGPS